jgi:hypothetical protein
MEGLPRTDRSIFITREQCAIVIVLSEAVLFTGTHARQKTESLDDKRKERSGEEREQFYTKLSILSDKLNLKL